MRTTWVLVADSTRARLMEAENAIGPLREIETLVHPESRLHERDINTDSPGRAFDSGGQGRHAMGQHVGAKEHEAGTFVRDISHRLDRGRKSGDLKQLVIVAAPALLGLLRKHMSAETARLITLELDKNITQMDISELRAHLPERLPQLGT
ncbi:MAG: host attachment protein [Pseudomonadota bacterium]|nr:host attachment protein [Pseudomonadota bacterium]